MNKLSAQKAPQAIGPYSQGYEANGFLFTSGQIAIIPETGEIPEGIAAQADQCCKNVGAILEAAGFAMSSKQPVFLPIWKILPRSMKYMQSILHQDRPEAVLP